MSGVFDIDQPDGLIDQPRRVVARGLAPGNARLTAESVHQDGSVWRSEAWFEVGGDGTLDLDAAVPSKGDWNVAEPMAYVWAMRRMKEPCSAQPGEGVEPRHISLALEDASGSTIHAELTQRFLAPGVQRREVREGGMYGVVFTPPGDGPHPVVLALNGSGGGTPEQRAALLAAHGYIGFALAYFKAPGLPDHISRTPLEYFGSALEWVANNLQPKDDFIAVMGVSRGGELSLLLGATYPDRVSAVVGYVPSIVVHGTLRAGAPGEPRDTTTWTWRGKPLRNVWQDNPLADWTAFDHPPRPGAPIRQEPAFTRVQQHAPSVAAARIPVERIAGSVLLVSGSDDGFWPSEAYSDQVVADLKAAGHARPVEHLANPDAGHAIEFPFVPTTLIAKPHPVAGVVLDGGGTPLGNARANRLSWSRVLGFLNEAQAVHQQIRKGA